MGILSAFAFLIPVCIIIVCRLFTNKSLLALLFYFLLTALFNLMVTNIIIIPRIWETRFGVFINYLDAPLMLAVLLFFCRTPKHKKAIEFSLYAFLGYQLIITLFYGFNLRSVVYILGPGVVLIFIYAGYFFSHYVKLSIERNKGFGKTLMITSLVFAYGCYAMVYCFYYLQFTTAIADVFLIYYIASLLATSLMSIGLIGYNKRLMQIKDVQVTRRELKAFFGS